MREGGKPWWRDHLVAHRPWELLLMRVLFALLVMMTVQWGISYEGQPKPNGIAKLGVDLTWFGDPAVQSQLQAITVVALVFYIMGALPHVALGVVAVVAIGIGTLENSQGWIGHSSQLVTMMVLGQALVYAFRPRLLADAGAHHRAVHGAKVVFAAAYLVCGLSKVLRSYGLWVWNAPFLALQFVKTREMEYYNRLEMQAPDSWIDQLPDLILEYPNLSRAFFGAGLLVELIVPLALIGRRWALGIGLLVILLHCTISVAMRLNFEPHIFAAAIFLVNAPWWVAAGWKWTQRERVIVARSA